MTKKALITGIIEPGRCLFRRIPARQGLLRCTVSSDALRFRSTKIDSLLGDASKVREKLGLQLRAIFAKLVAEIVREDLKAAERDKLVKRHEIMRHGYKVMDHEV